MEFIKDKTYYYSKDIGIVHMFYKRKNNINYFFENLAGVSISFSIAAVPVFIRESEDLAMIESYKENIDRVNFVLQTHIDIVKKYTDELNELRHKQQPLKDKYPEEYI